MPAPEQAEFEKTAASLEAVKKVGGAITILSRIQRKVIPGERGDVPNRFEVKLKKENGEWTLAFEISGGNQSIAEAVGEINKLGITGALDELSETGVQRFYFEIILPHVNEQVKEALWHALHTGYETGITYDPGLIEAFKKSDE
jgi:hypothetical protein